jgi:seryl-tRNA synthetase
VQPYIKDIYDLADTDKVITHHPFIVGHFVRLEIEAWREEQIRPLQNNMDQLRSRQSSLEAQLMRAEDSKDDCSADELRNEIAALQSKVAELEKVH